MNDQRKIVNKNKMIDRLEKTTNRRNLIEEWNKKSRSVQKIG